jgi:hypothetical protein
MKMAFEKDNEMSGEFFKFTNIGDSLTGVYLGSFPFNGKYGPTTKLIFKTQEGLKAVVPSKVLSDWADTKTPGQLVRITYSASKPSKQGNPTKLFDFEVDTSYVADDADIEAALAGQEEDVVEAPPATTARAKAAPSGAAVSSARQAELAARLNNRKTG